MVSLPDQLGEHGSQEEDEQLPSLESVSSPLSSPSVAPLNSSFSIIASTSNSTNSGSEEDSSQSSSGSEQLASRHSNHPASSSSDHLRNNTLQLPAMHLGFPATNRQSLFAPSPTLFPDLFVLNQLYDRVQNSPEAKPDLSNIIFACGQHLLNTTGSLFKMLIKLGAQAKNIFVIGKSYSNCKDVIIGLKNELEMINVYEGTRRDAFGDFAHTYSRDVYKMWNDIETHIKTERAKGVSIESIIVLDDGGHVLQEMSASTRLLCKYNIGIEQTTSGGGSAMTRPFPVIQVCSSALKNWCEPPMVSSIVARKVKEKIDKLLAADTKRRDFEVIYGVVGFGHIGSAVTQALLDLRYKNILIYDNESIKRQRAKEKFAKYSNVVIVDSIDGLYAGAEVIIGCTGQDISLGKLDAFEYARTSKVLISCSSKDVEFHSLLERLQIQNPAPKDPMLDFTFTNKVGSNVMIVKGGLPINFDNTAYSVPPREIQLIRGLKLAAVLQAVKMIQDWKKTDKMIIRNYQLDAAEQQWMFNEWIKVNPDQKCWKPFVNFVADINEITRKSGGYQYVSPPPDVSPQLTTRLHM
jgi:hypothetical protein